VFDGRRLSAPAIARARRRGATMHSAIAAHHQIASSLPSADLIWLIRIMAVGCSGGLVLVAFAAVQIVAR